MFLCVYSPASKRALGSLLVLGLNVLPFVMHFALVVCNVWIKVDITHLSFYYHFHISNIIEANIFLCTSYREASQVRCTHSSLVESYARVPLSKALHSNLLLSTQVYKWVPDYAGKVNSLVTLSQQHRDQSVVKRKWVPLDALKSVPAQFTLLLSHVVQFIHREI